MKLLPFFLPRLTCLVLLLLLACQPPQADTLSLNDGAKTFSFSRSAGPIAVALEGVAQTPGSELPYFELVVNQSLLTAQDPVWAFTERQERAMGNGGTEHQLDFVVAKGPAEGLLLRLYQQVFPGSSLLREKLELRATEGQSFTLNHQDGALHFRFPQYALPAAEATVQEIRLASWEHQPIPYARAGDPPGKSNHMYYPRLEAYPLSAGSSQLVKGPFSLLQTADYTFGLAYEHASQDDLKGLLDETKVANDGRIVDAMQGTKGVFDFPIRAEDFHFLGLRSTHAGEQLQVGVEALRGAYLEGEVIDADHPYASVWTAHFSHAGNDLEESKALIRAYLLHHICEKPASRQPEFYYNTWGMQRASEELRDVLSYENIFREIESAAQLGVDLFVLDDGWQEKHGDWTPNQQRLPQGLAPIKAKLDAHGMKMGIWLSPPTIDSTTERYRQHPDWVIKDSEGNPIQAQWGHCAFDMVSDFQALFVEDCKRLIDQGARFFKWDAINTFYSDLPGLHHGSADDSPAARRARYAYLLPIYVVAAMQELTEYEPELIIEVDLTEARRVMTGLAPLSQGKLFWMNNGASGYNDYGPYRTQSMRTIPNAFAGLVPLELFTYATYPHEQAGSQAYNVHTSLIAGHGFWGKLDLMDEAARRRVGETVAQAKRVLPYLLDNDPQVEGRVGDSPEIYTQVNGAAAAGQVIAFSSEPVGELERTVAVEPDQLLAVLGAPYAPAEAGVSLRLRLDQPYATQAAFLLPNGEAGVRILASEAVLADARLEAGSLRYVTAGAGPQTVFWPGTKAPQVQGAEVSVTEVEGGYELLLRPLAVGQAVVIGLGE